MQKPGNPKLWAMVVAQARAKYHPYPSAGASHWVHSEYIKHGGHFLGTSDKESKKTMLGRQFLAKYNAEAKEVKDNA